MERKSLLWSCQGGGEGQDLDLCGENIYGQPREGAHVTDRMGKVDGNLIYMLWQLLVVRQEFNKVNTD